MDLRIEKTRKSIINAFIEIRAKKALEKITIKELCEMAQINKSTFYSHYHDIYDLSEQLENEVVASVIEELTHPEYIIENPEQVSRELFEGYLSKDTLINILFSGTRSNLLVCKIEKSIKELMYTMYPEFKDDIKKNIMLTYTIYGGYYAFYENRQYGAESAIEVISKLAAIAKKF